MVDDAPTTPEPVGWLSSFCEALVVAVDAHDPTATPDGEKHIALLLAGRFPLHSDQIATAVDIVAQLRTILRDTGIDFELVMIPNSPATLC